MVMIEQKAIPMDNKTQQPREKEEIKTTLTDKKNSEQSSTQEGNNSEDGITEDDMEAERKFREAQTERD